MAEMGNISYFKLSWQKLLYSHSSVILGNIVCSVMFKKQSEISYKMFQRVVKTVDFLEVYPKVVSHQKSHNGWIHMWSVREVDTVSM